MSLGLIVRMDKSGLGQGQTKRLARLLQPDFLMVIDSTSFNQARQFPEWYAGYNQMVIHGFPTTEQVTAFCQEVDIVISCETFYHNYFVEIARQNNTKTVLIANYEFLDYHQLDYRHPLPDKLVFPSSWNFDLMQNPTYIPTPIFDDEFQQALETNLKREGKRKYLFINGKSAIHDRNGLDSLYEALQLSKGDFTVTVKTQGNVKRHPDPRLIYDTSNPDEQYKLYEGFDALILPRRYAGQCLPMTEALLSGLPVVMTDIDPNNKILPQKWLVPANKTGEFMTRTMIDIYNADPQALADKLDDLETGRAAKEHAYTLGSQFTADSLSLIYNNLIKELT